MSEGPQETGTIDVSPPRQQSEAEMVIDLLRTFQEELKALTARQELLDAKVNKELPAQLDTAFKEIQQNFTVITKGLEAIGQQPQTQLAQAAGSPQGGSSGIMGLVENIFKRITEAEAPATAGTSAEVAEFDKNIALMSRQLISMTYKKALKDFGKSAGVEIADHMVVEP